MSKVRGKFETFEGTVTTGDDISDSRVDVSVDLSSINTGTVDRDNHLRSSDFFEVDTNPTMTFTATNVIEKDAGELVVIGDLTIKGVTKSLELATEFLGEGSDPWGGTRIGVEATGQISRKEFGVDFNIPLDGDKVMIGDKVVITINAEAVLQS
jgi:polyisoprenoid-binding protein YceI